MSTPYVDPVINDILYQINYSAGSGNDVTLLSAIPYLPAASTTVDPFASALQEKAVNKLTSTFSYIAGTNQTTNPANNHVWNITTTTSSTDTGNLIVNPTVTSKLANVILTGATKSIFPFQGLKAKSTITTSDLLETFYQAGSSVFLDILCDRINAETTTTTTGTTTSALTNAGHIFGYGANIAADSPIDPSNTANPVTFQNIVDGVRTNVDHWTTGTDSVPPNVVQFLKSIGIPASSGTTASQTEIEDYTYMTDMIDKAWNRILTSKAAQNATILTNADTVKALKTFGLGPWIILKFLSLFSSNPSSSLVTQAYARVAIYYVSIIAFTNIANDIQTADPTKYGDLVAVISNLNTQLLNSAKDVANAGPIADVLNLSKQNKATADDIGVLSNTLQNRVGIASDLQTSYELESKKAQARKTVFYAWMIAYILVLVTSIVLIMNDRVGIFLGFAYGTLGLIAVVFGLYWMIQWIRTTFSLEA